ncbi:hypothetical protein [Roseospira visakhapatnamensis]|uniref:Uncharacterized protein n=1 Tax=Roseospira visakhapatnamensis TaxID=390880 RepID=A0A7W6W8E8_9PROT|nr:hypothetical protein [Roseospira visakhapatnamensis]MBB4264799.1 hypothetical protein [Roseospira visakhapatnamensis]
MTMTTATEAPDGRTHYYRHISGGVRVLQWTSHGEPHCDAFLAVTQVIGLAGVQGRHPGIYRAVRTALTAYCQDRAIPVARVEGCRCFPTHAVEAWLADGGRVFIGEKLAALPAQKDGSSVVPFSRRPRE